MIDPRLADYELDSYPKAPEPKPAPARASEGIQAQRKAKLTPLEEVRQQLAKGIRLRFKGHSGKIVR